MLNPFILKKKIKYLPGMICIFLFIANLFFILRYSIDIPFWDEWGFLIPNALSKDLNISWLFRQHNEHRIILTKLVGWILYRLFDWNLTYSIILNWFIFGALLGEVALFLPRFSEKEKLSILWFFPFLFSTLAYENHTWAFQSQFHFFLLFFILATRLLFQPKLTSGKILLGGMCCILSTFSFSAGFICSLSLAGCFSLW